MKGLKRQKGSMPKVASIPPLQPAFQGPGFPQSVAQIAKANSKPSGLLVDPTLPNPLAKARRLKKVGKT
jgi:hypothetical protein